MKPLFFFLTLFFFTQHQTACKQEVFGMPYHNYTVDTLNKLGLEGIQNRIYNAFVQSIMEQKDDKFLSIRQELAALYDKNKEPIIQYWQGYLQYYYSIYFLKINKTAEAEREVNLGIDILNEISQKNSEDLALLAMLQSFSIQFKSGIAAGSMSSKVKKNIDKALKLDSENLRAHYVGGSSDFYTPEKYGGGKQVEKYLLKAISLPDQKVVNNTIPSWGKDLAYELLLKYYIGKEDWTNAKKYYQEAVTKYPESYMINQLASKLVGK